MVMKLVCNVALFQSKVECSFDMSREEILAVGRNICYVMGGIVLIKAIGAVFQRQPKVTRRK